MNAFTADIDFTVEDPAQNIADQVNEQMVLAGSLDDAERVIVASGAAIEAVDAAAVQAISGYDGIAAN